MVPRVDGTQQNNRIVLGCIVSPRDVGTFRGKEYDAEALGRISRMTATGGADGAPSYTSSTARHPPIVPGTAVFHIRSFCSDCFLLYIHSCLPKQNIMCVPFKSIATPAHTLIGPSRASPKVWFQLHFAPIPSLRWS